MVKNTCLAAKPYASFPTTITAYVSESTEGRKPERTSQKATPLLAAQLVPCPDVKFSIPHEKISNPKKEAATASALICMYYIFRQNKLQTSSVRVLLSIEKVHG